MSWVRRRADRRRQSRSRCRRPNGRDTDDGGDWIGDDAGQRRLLAGQGHEARHLEPTSLPGDGDRRSAVDGIVATGPDRSFRDGRAGPRGRSVRHSVVRRERTGRGLPSGRTTVTDAVARRAIDRIGDNLRTAVYNGEDVAARRSMSLATLLAGMSFSNTGLGAAHPIATAAGAEYPSPTARGLQRPSRLSRATRHPGQPTATPRSRRCWVPTRKSRRPGRRSAGGRGRRRPRRRCGDSRRTVGPRNRGVRPRSACRPNDGPPATTRRQSAPCRAGGRRLCLPPGSVSTRPLRAARGPVCRPPSR